MRLRTFTIIGFAVLLVGCDLILPPPKKAATTAAAPAQSPVAAPPTLPGSAGILAPGDLNEMSQPVSPSPGTAPAAAPAVPPVQRDVAGVGSGIKGRSLDDPKLVGALVAPARAYFSTKERIAFEIEVPHALNLYKATEGNGPMSHEEFMEKIIVANNIKLPALPPGHRYIYDPTTEQLMVEKPAK